MEGPGFIDCHLYQQQEHQQPPRLVLHLVNLTNAGTWRAPVDELIPIGPLHVRVRLPKGASGTPVRSLVTNRKMDATLKSGWVEFKVPTVLDHDVVVIG